MCRQNLVPFFFLLSMTGILFGHQQNKQELPPEQHEAEVRLVLVDVIVTLDGRFVKDLNINDFELYEDGKKIPINSCELFSFEERSLQIKKRPISPPKIPRKRLAVIFDSVNTGFRDLGIQMDRIVHELLSIIELGNEIMICQLSFQNGLEILQPFTSNSELIRRSVEKAAGAVWNLELETPLMPVEIGGLYRFTRTTGGILGIINLLKSYPGRKSILFVSSGIPQMHSYHKEKQNFTISGINDPFGILRENVYTDSSEVLEEIINYSNSQNISFYSLSTDIFSKLAYTGPTVEDAREEDFDISKRMDGSIFDKALSLRWLSEDTGGDFFRGADKLAQFRQVVETDLNFYYELSYYPPRKTEDDKFHTIDIRVNRKGVNVRHRKGYTDYSHSSRAKMDLIAALYNPSLFQDLPFEAEFIPFLSDIGKFIPWINISLPTKEFFLDRFTGYKQLIYHCHIWIHDRLKGEEGYSGKINLPFTIEESFMDYIRQTPILDIHYRGPELNYTQNEFQTVLALEDSEINEIGAWESLVYLPELKKLESGQIINCVLGYTKVNPEIKQDTFILSKRDGSLEYRDIQFFPKIIKELSHDDRAHVFIQAYLPLGEGKSKPEFYIKGKDLQVYPVSTDLIAETWDDKTKIWNGLYSMDLNAASEGENSLYIEFPVPEDGSVLSHEMNFTCKSRAIPVEPTPKHVPMKSAAKPEKDITQTSKEKSESLPEPQQGIPSELDQILKGCEVYYRKVASSVLDFVCEEKVTEEKFVLERVSMSPIEMSALVRSSFIPKSLPRSKRKLTDKNEYVYDYQYIRKGQAFKEQRILIQENKEKRYIKNHELKTRFRHEYMIMGPLTLLSKARQLFHDYRIIGKKNLWGKKVTIIEAVPKPGHSFQHLWGEIWVNMEDFSILKIEWNQKSIQGHENLPENCEVDLSTEYKFEKNGIRFPSLFTLKENYITAPPLKRKYTLTEIKASYENYLFFMVETEIKY